MNINDYLDGADKARSDVEQMMGERDCQDGYKCPEDATEDYKRGYSMMYAWEQTATEFGMRARK